MSRSGGATIIGGGVIKSSSIEGNQVRRDLKLISSKNQIRFKAFCFKTLSTLFIPSKQDRLRRVKAGAFQSKSTRPMEVGWLILMLSDRIWDMLCSMTGCINGQINDKGCLRSTPAAVQISSDTGPNDIPTPKVHVGIPCSCSQLNLVTFPHSTAIDHLLLPLSSQPRWH